MSRCCRERVEICFFFFFGHFLDGCFFSRYFVWMCVSQSQTNILQFLSYLQLHKCCMCQGTAWVMFVFKNILIMLGTQLSSDCENKYLSLQHAPSSNWILYHHPLTHTHTNHPVIFMLSGAFPRGGVESQAMLWVLWVTALHIHPAVH